MKPTPNLGPTRMLGRMIICLFFVFVHNFGSLLTAAAMESPLLRSGVMAAQLALGICPNAKTEPMDELKTEKTEEKAVVKTEAKAEATQRELTYVYFGVVHYWF